MPTALLVVLFLLGAGISLAASWLLVARIERIGGRRGLSEPLLGVIAAFAADGPEITAAVTALASHNSRIGAGVVIGSNVFNLAALLGLAALVAGRIVLHRRAVLLEGAVAAWTAVACLLVVVGVLSPPVGLIIVGVVLVPYLVALGAGPRGLARLRLPKASRAWLESAVAEEQSEQREAIREWPSGGRRDRLEAGVALLVVVAASVLMEQTGTRLGARGHIPGIVVGGLVLAGVTSMPNAVAAIYLAVRGRGAATLSTAMNSNALNVFAGLLIPGSLAGLGPPSGQSTFVAAWYLGLTVFSLLAAYAWRGLRRVYGSLIVGAYGLFVLVLLLIA